MSQGLAPYGALAALLRYPGASFPEELAGVRETLDATSLDEQEPDENRRKALESLNQFVEQVAGSRISELEELYAQTFDFDPKCTLEIGWHLFGEEYERGAFLVRLRGLLRKHGVAEVTELPDHLSHLLALLPRLDPDEAGRLTTSCVLPALDTILVGFAGTENPYWHLLRSVQCFLAAEQVATGQPERPTSIASEHSEGGDSSRVSEPGCLIPHASCLAPTQMDRGKP